MTREFLKKLGLEDAAIDQILDENMDDIGKEKAKTTAAKAALTEAQSQLTAAQTELEGLKTAGGDIAAVRQQLTELQAKYDTDTKALQGQLADRDYGDAISRAIAGRGLKFSSKSAERAFTAALRERKLALKDGELTGLDDFIKAQKEADPEAFAPDKAPPRIVTGNSGRGGHGEPPKTPSRAAQLAAEHHASLYGEVKKE